MLLRGIPYQLHRWTFFASYNFSQISTTTNALPAACILLSSIVFTTYQHDSTRAVMTKLISEVSTGNKVSQ